MSLSFSIYKQGIIWESGDKLYEQKKKQGEYVGAESRYCDFDRRRIRIDIKSDTARDGSAGYYGGS
ncbi:hypothetical protein GCM10007275_02680 [Jeotgalicoccus coquinae]|nr:hypothetical protein GCM10007275_02680 [Jeotgalicoccus coquinae]